MERRACYDAATLEVRRCGQTFAECVHCGDSVRDDLVDHPFWGFQNCKEKKREAQAADVEAK